jgi:hypothetical protein
MGRAPVNVCWDLDNTLVESGTLVHGGRTPEQAIVEAGPMPGMLEFAAAIAEELPDAAHFALSVRERGMRADTLAWLRLHEVRLEPEAVFFVPTPAGKAAVWRDLAAGARLLIVDDLSFDHESGAPSVHHDVVLEARRLGDVYLGIEEIAAIGADPARARAAAADVARRLRSR